MPPPVKSRIAQWKERSNPKMLSLFTRTHTQQKSVASVDSLDDNITALDPPVLNGVPFFAAQNTTPAPPQNHRNSVASQHFGHLAQKHALDFTKRAADQESTPSPTESHFSSNNYNIVSNGLQGEKERNMILEEQVRMLSHQAALALDRLSEVSKENDLLRTENELLAKKSSRFSRVNRQSSVASSQSSTSVFSKDQSMSQASSMSSIQSHLRSNSVYLEEMTQSYEKEMNVMKQQLTHVHDRLTKSTEQVKLLTDESTQLKEQLSSNTSTITRLHAQITQLTTHLEESKNENTKLLRRFSTKKKQAALEIEQCKKQLADLVEQLMYRQQQDLKLRERMLRYDECNSTIKTAASMLTTV